ncbi:MAG TPA: tRNA lysidine(34) synthetase TilS [Bacteroidota bacterium]|nr:tRNA lysidine(34) synthetase TilS [Bacteroidota bacterium]
MLSPATLPSRFHEFATRQRLFAEGDALVVAVSGGADSMVLLELLRRQRSLKLCLAHCNHTLRGSESDADQSFVEEYARASGLPCEVCRADTAGQAQSRGLGIPEAAREIRYTFLHEVRQRRGARSIATAHHADDNAETILMHLFRGAGVRGMAGIALSSGGVVRPLLFARRQEIEEFARAERIAFRTDSSNGKDAYQRNAIRHHLMPLLERISGDAAVDNINRAGERFRGLADYIGQESARVLASCLQRSEQGIEQLDVAALLSHPRFLQEHAVLSLLEGWVGAQTASEHVLAVLELALKEPGARVLLPGGAEVYRERKDLLLLRAREEAPFSLPVEPGAQYAIGPYRFASCYVQTPGPFGGPCREFIDAERIGGRRLSLRSWREGDAFFPLGMRGRKKISDFFVDEKVPLHEKQRIPILVTDDGDVIWVCGRRLDERFKITQSTRRVLQLEFTRTSPDEKADHGQR